MSLREVALSGRDMGAVRLTGTVGGIGPEIFASGMPASELLMFTASAKTLDLTVENTGLFERFIATQSRALSLKPEELRQEYVSASQFGVPIILGGSAGARAIGTAMGQFVQKPGRLVLKARARDAAASASPTSPSPARPPRSSTGSRSRPRRSRRPPPPSLSSCREGRARRHLPPHTISG